MDTTNVSIHPTAVRGLAVVGFIALITAGMWFAVHSTRFVPAAVNRIGSAAVYLGSVFVPAPAPTLSVVPTPNASTTIVFSTASSSTLVATPTQPAKTAVGTKTNTTFQIEGTPTPTLFGLPDLSVSIDTVGYLTTAATDSFVVSPTVLPGRRPAIKFTIKNIGTNWSGTWRFSASIPTQTVFVYQSQPQQSLAPGDSVDYTLGFDRANIGANQTIVITANFDRAAADSNPNNNSASVTVTILGS